MSQKIYYSSTNYAVTSFTITENSKYIIYTELSISGPLRSSIHLCNTHTQNNVSFKLPLNLGIHDDSDFSTLNQIKLVDVPLITGNLVEKKSFLVLNVGNGIQLIELEQLFGLTEKLGKVPKWYLNNNKDRILSFIAKGSKEGSIEIWFCTKLGIASRIEYSIASERFHSFKQLMDPGNDVLNYISEGYSEFKTWEEDLGSIRQAAMACFDNCIYWINDKTIEKKKILQMNNEVKNSLTNVTFATVKQLKTTSIIYFCGSVTNIGCLLYKRNIQGDWDLVYVFNRQIDEDETSPLVNCEMSYDASSNTLKIVSGSECGKIYCWKYDYKLQMEMENDTVTVGGFKDIIHSIRLVRNSKVYFIRNRAEICCVDI